MSAGIHTVSTKITLDTDASCWFTIKGAGKVPTSSMAAYPVLSSFATIIDWDTSDDLFYIDDNGTYVLQNPFFVISTKSAKFKLQYS